MGHQNELYTGTKQFVGAFRCRVNMLCRLLGTSITSLRLNLMSPAKAFQIQKQQLVSQLKSSETTNLSKIFESYKPAYALIRQLRRHPWPAHLSNKLVNVAFSLTLEEAHNFRAGAAFCLFGCILGTSIFQTPLFDLVLVIGGIILARMLNFVYEARCLKNRAEEILRSLGQTGGGDCVNSLDDFLQGIKRSFEQNLVEIPQETQNIANSWFDRMFRE
ncbi:MAG: hypothetical protein NZO16_04785 [Deltaproteobacteria bacterium]|nr:hypothetical protein [Deltaproteobacteria bacterium]